VIIQFKDYIQHYGTPRHSGRYPWGSGKDPDQHHRSTSFLQRVDELKKQGLTDAEVAKGMGLKSTTQLRAQKSIAINEQKQQRINMATRLSEKGMSNVSIGERMGINESSVRSLLNPDLQRKANVLEATSNMIREQVEKKGYVDIGAGVENQLGISQTKFRTAVAILKEEGYSTHYFSVPQLGTGKNTSHIMLAKPDIPWSEVNTAVREGRTHQITDYSKDGGKTYEKLPPLTSISSKRVGVNYAEDGGTKADGVIYVRPGVKDVSLGNSSYAQVRIPVDGTHYIKGMAVYKDDLPDGVDLVFNTNKSRSEGKKGVMKEMEKTPDGKVDLDNPFGASILRRQGHMSIVNEEGKWDEWSKNLPSQMLSKQNPDLAKQQLNLTYERRRKELDEISSLTNPVVKRKLLESFADETDSAAVHLKAANLPKQATKVLLPITKIKEHEIYAPSFRDGERVALVRFPHGGTFEIPQLTVNNRNPEGRKLLGPQAKDAVGIHHKVAERLSGADFDGDTALVIPNNRKLITSTPALEGLKGFDPRASYPAYSGMPRMKPETKQKEMGKITNLIADMSIHGANSDEMSRAVRHSMVVIDAEKHHLDYKSSAKDNSIAALKSKYQGGPTSGASTLITRAGSEQRVTKRKLRPASQGGPIDPVTGHKVYVDDPKATFVTKEGKTVTRTEKSKKLAETHDAHTLSSGTPIEKIYADHSNSLKALANDARKEILVTKNNPYSPSAKAVYSNEVVTLNAKLNTALRNKPLERQAQILANATVSAKRQANPDMDDDTLKKIKNQALDESRIRTGAQKQRIVITQDEWNAIQAGAISSHKLSEILDKSDLDTVRQLATPRERTVMTSVKQARAKSMLASGYTQADIADALGVSLTTLKTFINEG
jgi:DNA-binding CsgD family transcriptional regulator